MAGRHIRILCHHKGAEAVRHHCNPPFNHPVDEFSQPLRQFDELDIPLAVVRGDE